MNKLEKLQNLANIVFIIIFVVQMTKQWVYSRASKIDYKKVEQNKKIVHEICRYYFCRSIPKEYQDKVYSFMFIFYNIMNWIPIILIGSLSLLMKEIPGGLVRLLYFLCISEFFAPIGTLIRGFHFFPKKEQAQFFLWIIGCSFLLWIFQFVPNIYLQYAIVFVGMQVVLWINIQVKNYFYSYICFSQKELDVLLPERKNK